MTSNPSHGADQAAEVAESDSLLRWPLDLPDRYLTSNFMEYRDGRYHAGLDLKTNSQCGYPVYAAEDGWVGRLRTAANGYGRAVYLHGNSGRIYVYAHLERFADSLRLQVEKEQRQRGGYRVDFSLTKDRIPLQRGDLLGLSGQSGTLGPHLHFEVRNSRQEPLNPHELGFSIPDSLSPRITKIRVLPAEPDARVEGGVVARSLAASYGLTGQLPPLTVRGAIAFSCAIVDYSDRHQHRLEPHQITVRLDGREVYRLRNESFAFASNAQIRLEWLAVAGIREHWLHRRPGIRVPGRSGEAWSLQPGGLLAGEHLVELEVTDWNGNRSRAVWPLTVLADSVACSDSFVHQDSAAAGWQIDPARIRLSSVEQPVCLWLTPFLFYTTEDDRVGLVRPALLPPPGTEPPPAASTANQVEAADPQALLLAGGARARIFCPSADPVLAESVVWSRPDSLDTRERAAASRQQGLLHLVSCGRYHSADWPATGSLEQTCRAGVDSLLLSADVGLYLQEGSGNWGYVGKPSTAVAGTAPVLMADALLQIRISGPGRYAVFRDSAPPRLGDGRQRIEVGLRKREPVAGCTWPRWERVVIPIIDKGSGIDADSIDAVCDDQPLYPEPDLPRQRLLVELPDSLPPGEHRLEITVNDRANLDATYSVLLICGDPGAKQEPKSDRDPGEEVDENP
ncbi:MAG: M23 family metallopeptidase [bacterium]